MNKNVSLITIGYSKRLLEAGSRERVRMIEYSMQLEAMHIIVFTKKTENFPPVQQVNNLFLYATNSRFRLFMLIKAILIGRQIINKSKDKKWIVSAQDPFETSLVARAIALFNQAISHVQIHGDVFNKFNYQNSWLQKLRVVYGKYVVRHSPGIRVVSERIKNSLLDLGVQESKIKVIPIQLDLETFSSVGKQRIFLDSDTVNFLYVGRLASEKNVSLIIKSLQNLASEFYNFNLTILGDGPLKFDLLNQVKQAGLENKIKFLAWTENVSEVMAKHQVLLLASNHEGWGMVLSEAAAAGLAIITTDVGAAGEIVINNQNGLVVPVGDSKEYTTAIKKYLTNPVLINEHGENSLRQAAKFNLSKEEYLNSLIKSYTLLV